MANYFETFPQEKFALVNENKPLRDKELITKPRGFFADAMFRFSRNKGSIVAAVIIGILFLYAIIAPLCTPYQVSTNDAYLKYALPKLFDNSIDFYDGCAKKTVSEINFVEYYAIGAETGVNAIKRQEYSTSVSASSGETLYTFRLDSYRSKGNIFMNGVTQETMESIQDYQDANNVQIIYPITDPSKRPTAKQDVRNANFWYETEQIDGKTAPVNYTIGGDGKITYNNIYKEYVQPSLTSSASYLAAPGVVPNAKMEPVDGGFHISFRKVTTSELDNGETIETVSYKYIEALAEGHINLLSLTDKPALAAKFQYDATNKGLYVTIDGHDDASLDGDYYLGLRSDIGSKILLFPKASYDPDQHVLLNAFTDDGVTQITDFSSEKRGYLASVRSSVKSDKLFVNFDVLSGSTSLDGSKKGVFYTKASGSGYYFKTDNSKFPKYFGIKVSGTTAGLQSVGNTDAAALWHVNETTKRISTEINSFSDTTLNGEYFLAMAKNGSSYAFTMVKEGDLANVVPITLADSEGRTLTDAVADATGYTFRGDYEETILSPYYATGSTDGDNYYSKMRVEGEDNYLYSYAINNDGVYEIRVNYYEYYRYYHQVIAKDGINYPLFLFGSNDAGQDIFVCLASGARFSFILAITVSAVNMFVGAIYGAIEGYYGGKIDLVMERIVEILSAVPFMIVITLLRYHMKGSSQVLVLFISFFLTGWIGESGTVRMQFYRFKNQEYVLAARTLGAKDPRIMFRHIFPNALGTIVTGSVLVIPGMIFSETSLSYLGIINLNSGSMTSVGTLLANGQPYLTTYPHIIIFPAIFISLLMLSFNLFGNGLRDAFNPSLRGTED